MSTTHKPMEYAVTVRGHMLIEKMLRTNNNTPYNAKGIDDALWYSARSLSPSNSRNLFLMKNVELVNTNWQTAVITSKAPMVI